MSDAPVLVIGGTRGIGRCLAEVLIERGTPVITLARSTEAPQGVLRHIAADVLDEDVHLEGIPDALSGFAYCPGSIDLKPLRSIRPSDLRLALEINVVGAFRWAQVASERLKRVPGSGMVFFSTVAVGQGMPFHASIATAKGGVEGLARSLAAELAPVVRVNCIAPSLSDTPLAERLLNSPEKQRSAADRHPLKRVGVSADSAAMAAFLLGPDAGWITGQLIGVDGGLSRLR